MHNNVESDFLKYKLLEVLLNNTKGKKEEKKNFFKMVMDQYF